MSPQSTIGHYRIVAKLGEGGMGEVWRATDTRLNRDVAIKVLPPALANDAQYMARFEREAQTLAALNHPNIAAIYGVEQGAIVMELVEGETLPCPAPLDAAIDYARQIAAGLDAAHEKGIVHRDLKPANIRVTSDGIVKILDFGLAKASAETASAAQATISPTLSLAMTQAGMILGTAAYMSPEQARGKPVDKRADIWAFGVVLYEMLTGRMLFGGGDTVADTLASVMKDAPDLAALPPGTPAAIRRLLDHCLRKDPSRRLRDIGDTRLLLDESEPAIPVAAPAAPGRRAWLPWTIAASAILIAIAVGAAWIAAKTSAAPALPARFVLTPPPGHQLAVGPGTRQAAPSPDGRQIAFIGVDESRKSALWVRAIDEIAARRLERTDGAAYPFWSPDSQFIGFFADGKLKRIAASGASLQTVCDLPSNARTVTQVSGGGGAWGRDGYIVFSTGALFRVPAAGGTPAPLAAPGQTEDSVTGWPQILPDGRLLYFARGPSDTGGIYVQAPGAPRTRVLQTSTPAVWASPGYLLFTREGTLYAQAMDAKTSRLTGEPFVIADEVATNTLTHRSSVAASENGVLLFRRGRFQESVPRQLAWYDRTGKRLATVGQPGPLSNVALAPDEKTVAIIAGRDLWSIDLVTGVRTRLTSSGMQSLNIGTWSPDSQRFAGNLGFGGVQMVTVASHAAADFTREMLECQTWSPDGLSLLCIDASSGTRLHVVPADGSPPRIIQQTAHHQSYFRFSPGGKFVAYLSDESGKNEVFVASFPDFALKRQVSNGDSGYPSWNGDGTELFYRQAPRELMSVSIRAGAGIEAGVPKLLFSYGTQGAGNRFAVTRDGKRFLIMEPPADESTPQQMIVMLNWTALIR